jgi:hypothetical protein
MDPTGSGRDMAGVGGLHGLWRWLVLTLSVGVLVLGPIVVVRALQSPDSEGVIHACYKQNDGKLRVVASSSQCKNGEEYLSWSHQGPQGPKGEPGELRLAGQMCPEGQFVAGFDMHGDIVCSSPPTDPGPTACPVNTTADLYVDPTVEPVEGIEPTGVAAPAMCRFRSISAAVDELSSTGITGARIIATGGADTQPAIFADEQFPLTLPPGTLLTTTDDPALGGSGLDPARYIVHFDGEADTAIQLNGGGLQGLTLRSVRESNATTMAACDGSPTTLHSIVLDGASPNQGTVETGLQLASGCTLEATAIRVTGFAGDGITVAAGAQLSASGAKIHDNAGDGLVISGEAWVGDSVIAFNGGDGVLVTEGATAEFHRNDVRDNAASGFHVWLADVTFFGNMVHNNSRSTGWLLPQLWFRGGEGWLPWVDPWLQTPSHTLGSEGGCHVAPNRIWSYQGSSAGPPPGSVGLRASDGALVHTYYNMWKFGTAEDFTSDASSMITVAGVCDILPFDDPENPPPVD